MENVADAWLTDEEAARYMKFSEQWGWDTVQKLARDGKIKAGKNGKNWLFKIKDLDEYLYSRGKGK